MWVLITSWTVILLMTTAILTASDACATCSCTERSVNCSHRELQQVPSNLPQDALSLDLSHNLLHYLPDNVFQPLANLTVLNLSYNHLTNLTHGVFVGLCSLQWLSLSWNNISLSDKTYPEGVFSPFDKTLLYLYLNGNSPPNQTLKHSVSYPDKALSQLSNLTELFMDGLSDTRLGVGFGHLLSLNNLSLVGCQEGFCDLVTLHNDTFKHHPPALLYLNLSYCNIRCIEADAFGPLRALQILDLSYNEHLGFRRLGLAVYGLQGSALHALHIDQINPLFDVCISIDSSDTIYFKNTSIATIYARHNGLQFFFRGALLNMPDSLEFVQLDGNHLSFGRYLQDLNKLKRLKHIHVDGYSHPPQLPTDYPVMGRKRSETKSIGDSSLVPSRCAGPAQCRWSVVSERERGASWEPQLGYDATDMITDNATYFVLPPYLADFTSRQNQMYYEIMQVDFDPNNKLIRLDLSSNYLVTLIGPVNGLNSLRYLSLRNNFVQHMSDRFFSNFPFLKELNLNKNHLSDRSINTTNSMFARLLNLEVLDLSENDFFSLPKTVFSGLVHLKILNLSSNYLTSFIVDISSSKDLRLLDLSHNNIHSLPEPIRQQLDSIAEAKNVVLNLSYIFISCTCANIHFLSWMESSRVHFPKSGVYSCLMSDGSENRMIDVLAVKAQLKKECNSFVGIMVGAAGCLCCLVFALVSALVYRFRWKLRYLYHASRLSYRRMQSDHHQFFFDAFVSYASQDEDFVHEHLVHRLEEQESLRLYVHNRDFTPGRPIACNVVAAVENSRRTLVVLTRWWLQSDWCQYEMQMATMEAVHTGRDVLLFLLYEDIPSHELPRQVLYNLQSSTYIQFPHDDPSLLPTFWSRVSRAIRP